MIRLSDLLLETTPSEEADRMGLERKPGFGNYGPPGSDEVTHRSRGGKLVPVADTKGVGVGRGAGKATPSGRVTDRPTKASPRRDPSVPPKDLPPKKTTPDGDAMKKRADDRGGARKLADLLDTVPEQPMDAVVDGAFRSIEPQDIINGVQTALGVSPRTVRAYTEIGNVVPDHFRRAEFLADLGLSDAAGLYDGRHGDIWMAPMVREWFAAARKKSPRDWRVLHVQSTHVLIHETVHSTSPRLTPTQFRPLVVGGIPRSVALEALASPDALAMEEGLTEFLARRMGQRVCKNLGVPETEYADETYPAYGEWVTAVRLLATYGGLEPQKVFQKATVSELRDAFWKAEDETLTTLLQQEVGADAEVFERVMAVVHSFERRDRPHLETYMGKPAVISRKMAIQNPVFQHHLMNLVNDARAGSYSTITNQRVEHLMRTLY